MSDETREVLAKLVVANDGEMVSRLRLSAADAARVCQVTPRQLIYWTKKGLLRASDDDEHSYDVFAMERAIRIRQELAKGHSLERAAQTVARDIALLSAEAERLSAMTPAELEAELGRRLERVEARVAALRRSLPASLGLTRLRRAVAMIAQLEAQGTLGAGLESQRGKELTLRLGRAVDELEQLLREVPAAT